MRKFTYILSTLAIAISFNSCEAWEDESYHPGGELNENPMYLKEKITSIDGNVVSKDLYEYNENNRVKKITSYLNANDLTSYVLTEYTYNSDFNTTVKSKVYQDGNLVSESIMTTTGDQSTFTVEMSTDGENILTVTGNYTLPCGITTQTLSGNIVGEEFNQTSTFQYTDSNCSYKMLTDNSLAETVTKDDKFSPTVDEFILNGGIISRNIVKLVDHIDNTTTNYSYTYNDFNYPTNAIVTTIDNETQEELQNYTLEYTYY